jgi:hypothetical protein
MRRNHNGLAYSDRLHRPRRGECRRALRSRVSPEFHGSPARHCDTPASPPSECRHVILLPRRAAAKLLAAHARASSPARYRDATCLSQARLCSRPRQSA